MTLEQSWRDYVAKVIPRDACRIQIEETRRAFFAGAIAGLNAVDEHGREKFLREMNADLRALKGRFLDEGYS